MSIEKMLHIRGIRKYFCLFLVNRVFKGTNVRYFVIKRRLLNLAGYSIGPGTRVVGPVEWLGSVQIGSDCWIGKNCRVNGNGRVVIGDRCDIGPEVTFQTGGHEIGTSVRRAGKGKVFHQTVGNGVWIGGRSTICNNTDIGNACVIAGCACVTQSIEDNVMVGGVPARVIRRLLPDDSEVATE